MTTVVDIMSTDVVTVPEDMTVRALARTLDVKGIRGAPVVRADGRVVGVVSTADVARAAARAGGVDLDRTNVRQIMTPFTFSVRPGTSIPDLARMLVHARLHRALVLESGRVIGIVSADDILEHLAGVEGALHPARWPR